MRQRVMIAIALACNPALLIADEPTTALDVTIQAQILELMKRLQRDHGSSIVLITHDMGVVADVADRVLVMYAGRVVEEAPKARALPRRRSIPTRGACSARCPASTGPGCARLAAIPGRAAVTARATGRLRLRAALPASIRALLDAPGAARAHRARQKDACHLDPPYVPRCGRRHCAARSARARDRDDAVPPLLGGGRTRQALSGALRRAQPRQPTSLVHAVDGVSLAVRRGETLGVVGESGCGKSTLGRLLVRLHEPTSGTVTFDGTDITDLSRKELRPFRRETQMIFQDPYASLNPRKRVAQIVGDPFRIHRAGSSDEIRRAGAGAARGRRPLGPSHQSLSARVLRRATAADRRRARAGAESAADRGRRARLGARRVDPGAGREPARRPPGRVRLTYVFIAHDLGVVRHVSDRIAVMYLGVIVEDRTGGGALRAPDPSLHRGTPLRDSGDRDRRARAQPPPRRRIVLEGEVPSPIDPPSGCRFHPRCPYATEICRVETPPLADFGNGRFAACHHPLGGAVRPAEPLGTRRRRRIEWCSA